MEIRRWKSKGSRMIINIRGTHGSGKSTLVRRVRDLYDGQRPMMIPKRQRPLGYACTSSMVGPNPRLPPLFVVGSYETPTGGCDTIGSIEQIFELVTTMAEHSHVLFEGIVAQHSAGRLLDVALARPGEVTVIALSTPSEICVSSVEHRRLERGELTPLDPKNVLKEYKSVLSSSLRLQRDGLPVLQMSRDEAFAHVVNLLRSGQAVGKDAQVAGIKADAPVGNSVGNLAEET